MAEENIIIPNNDSDDEYDYWMEPFEMEIEEKKREEAAEKDSSNKRKREEVAEEESSNKRIDFRFEIDDEYDWMDLFEMEKMEMEREERQREEAAEKDSSNKRKREEAAEEESSNKRIDFRFEIGDEYDWMDLFEMEKMEMERQREEAAEKDSSNKRIDWMEPFDVEKLEMEIKERQREEAAQKDSSDKRIDFRFESDDEYYWMDQAVAEELEMEREEIEERQREIEERRREEEEDSSDWRIDFRFEIDDMKEFIQKKRERRSTTNFETSVVQFVKHQEIGLKKTRTNSLRKFLLSQEIRVWRDNNPNFYL